MAPSDVALRRSPLARLWQHPVGRGLLCAAGLCISAYWSVMTLSVLLLNTGGIGWLVACNTDDARVELGRAYSPWPGRVVFQDLHLEIHDSASHFDLRIARGTVDVDLMALLGRRFEGQHLNAEGARLQIRLTEAYRSREREARLPRLSAPKPAVGQTHAEDLWGVAVGIDSVIFEELWIDDARVRGRLAVNGAFDLQPLDYLSLSESRVELDACEIWLGEARVTHDLAGTVLASLPRTQVDDQAGQRLSKRAVITTKLAAKVSDIAPFGLYLGKDWDVFGGEGTLSVDARLRNHDLAAGSRFNYQSPALGVRRGNVSASGASMLTFSQQQHKHASWTYRDIDVRKHGLQTGPPIGHADTCKVEIEADGPPGELTISSASFHLAQASVAKLSVLPLELPDGFRRLAGAAEGDVHARYARGSIRGDASFQAEDVHLETDDFSLNGDAWLTASASARAPFRELQISRVSFDLRGARMTLNRKRTKPFRVTLDTTRYRFNWKTLQGDGPLQLKLSDSQVLQDVTGADVPGVGESLFGIQGLKLLVQTKLSPSLQDVKIIRGSSGQANVAGRLVRREKRARVVLLLSRGPLSVGIVAWPGDSSVVPLAGDDWLHEQLSRI
ncbi:MAG: hypothetical protein AB7K71_09400 [Polyangiaceae bacterium]